MKYCQRCKLFINTEKERCPLCFEAIADPLSAEKEACAPTAESASLPEQEKYPPGNEETASRYNFVFRFLLFISIVVVSVSVLVNILTYSGYLWCLIAIAAMLYLWAAIAYPIFTKKNIGQIIVIEAFCASLILYIIQVATNTEGWALEYAMPFLFSTATLMVTCIILIKRMKWRQFAVYQMATMLLGFIPILFCIFGLVKLIWPSLFSALYSFLTLVGMFVFADKKYKNEIIKRFHL